ncbi:MAG: ribonuclease PH [Magnetococcales bacterium]|nr:ribonuclease PH [Magnetococcales bacterium]MBF0149103.1 ribonuclease PH [Magnetococcales bacterium]MBF0173244.1 ribonuclease PH [Magnetococcales bacterium]MBF0632252.1 ribonuclease PH [Magnetococcales bacterium]
MRRNQRSPDQLRPITITRSFVDHAEGSCLITCGNTRVLCTASIEEKLPFWMRDQNRGWITAEYGMLPRATHTRTVREASRGKQSGRTLEIQRLIGRSMRAVVNLEKLGKRTIWIDCDVIQADGGTRTVSITGAFIALMDACRRLHEGGLLSELPIIDYIAAVSSGMVQNVPMLDLDYDEDSHCQTDMNFVMTGSGRFVEIQGTAEGSPFSRQEFDSMLALAEKGIKELIELQRKALNP